MSEKPNSDLRRRMLEDMAVRKFGDQTHNNYIRHVALFAKFLGRSPLVDSAPMKLSSPVEPEIRYPAMLLCPRFGA